ncbi:MAG: SMC family ATPase [Micrococcales bacterium]|nr:SMC family ATPase [Micrococcales bacterium]
MRIHSLEVSAFGPFRDRVDIDFDAVSDAGLFLVHGPTGAGKTSLLDAVCFALFADVPGDRSARSLASQHAEPGTRPVVTLDFTSSGRRLRVTRSPAFTRPGRGTDVPATVHLEEHDGSAWSTLATRHGEADDVIRTVIGLGRDQFARVVMLPQGDFAAFLRAGADERAQLLQRLFDVSGFTDVEAWLGQQRRAAAEQVRAESARLQEALRSLGDGLAALPHSVDADPLRETPPVADTDWTGLPIAEIPAALDGTLGQLEELAGLAQAVLDAASLDEATATTQESAARRTAELQTRGRRASLLLDEMAEGAAATDALRARLEAADRSACCDAAIGLQRAASDDASDAGERLATARLEALSTLTAEFAERVDLTAAAATLSPDMTGDLATFSPETAAFLAEPVTLTPGTAALLAEQLGAARSHSDPILLAGRAATAAAQQAHTWAGHADEILSAASTFEALESRRRTIADEIAAHSATAERSREAALALVSAKSALASLAERTSLLAQLAEARDSAARAGLAAEHAREVWTTAREQLVSLQEARLADMAGELAASLDDGCPCPVCGSTQHPTPAQRHSGVTPEQIEAAEGARADAESRHTRACAALARDQSQVETLVGRLGEGPLDAELTLAMAEATERVQSLTETAGQLSLATAALGRARDEASATAAEVTALQTRTSQLVEGLDAAAASTTQELLRLRGQLAEHRGDCCCVAVPDEAAARAAVSEAIEALGSAAGLDADGSRDRRAAAIGAGLTQAGQALTALAAALAGVRRGHTSTVTAVERLLTAHQTRETASATLRERAVALREVLRDNDFDDEAAALEAALPLRERTGLREQIGAYDREWTRAQDVLADAEVAVAMAADEPDLAAATERLRETKRAHLQAKAAETTAREALTRAQSQAARIRAQVGSLGPAQERSHALSALADLTQGHGDNVRKMALSTYVLAARLERVVSLSNERLATMGDGRYELEYDDTPANRRSRAGLGLAVRDRWTGHSRDTSTLSGGESFMVSLSLALGLADAVREEAGGFDLQTLFIDEGFGTLDEERLEEVMAVLDTLRSGGRAVGVVSHVGDLRLRIPVQIEVAKTPQGSSVRVRHDGTDASHDGTDASHDATDAGREGTDAA